MSDIASSRNCLTAAQASRARILSQTWGVECELMDRVVLVLDRVERELGRTPRVISGYRSRAEQDRLRRQGRPAAPDELSTHRVFPSRGVDISLGALPTADMIATFGRIVVLQGLRWGGGSPVDDRGIPSDWQHVDLGPRPPGLKSGP